MSSYAVLGATGNCGSSLIQILLQSPTNKVNAYCRNKAKLTRMLPDLTESKKVEIFEGSIDDTAMLSSCVRGCKAVFLVVTMNDNVPGCRVAQDTAANLIEAMRQLKAEDPNQPLPKLCVLSSATIDPYLSRKMPWWFHPVMIRAASHVYDDLKVQETLLRAEEDWLSTIFIKPGGLALDVQRGHKLDFDNEESFISYLDLAAAMVEAADDPTGHYDMRNVSVVNTGGSATFPKGTLTCITCGLLRHFFPALHPYLPFTSPS